MILVVAGNASTHGVEEVDLLMPGLLATSSATISTPVWGRHRWRVLSICHPVTEKSDLSCIGPLMKHGLDAGEKESVNGYSYLARIRVAIFVRVLERNV